MSALREALRLLRRGGRTIFLFEAVYKLAATALFLPFFRMLFSSLTRLTGIRYLTAENLPSFLLHPMTLLFILVLLALAALYTLADIGVVICALDQAAHGVPSGIPEILRFLARAVKQGFSRKNLWLLLYLPLLALFLHLGVEFGLMATVRIPVPIAAFFASRPLCWGLLALVLGAAGWLALRWAHAVSLMLLRALPFPEACRESSRLTRGERTRSLPLFLLAQALLTGFYMLLALGGILLLRLISDSLARSLLTSHVLTFLIAALLAVSTLSIPATFALEYALYSRRLRRDGLPFPHADIAPRTDAARRRRLRKACSVLALILSLAGCALIVYRFQRGHYNLDIEHLRATEITAHRGASASHPENTMAAFIAAWENGADWIELDVQQSQDGVLYCMHDSSFARTAGTPKWAWELTWEEILLLDAGSFFGQDFAGEPVPTLEAALDFARLFGLRLNIELKPTGHEQDLEETVVALIRQYGFEDGCVITSQKYRTLEKIKEIAPELTTAYVMPLAVGDIGRLTAADHFSVAFGSITRSMVSRVHQAGKQIYAWTVNRQDIINRMIDLGVDNIITDDIALARQCVSEAIASELVTTFLEELDR